MKRAAQGAVHAQSKATAPEPLPVVTLDSVLHRTDAEVARLKRPGGVRLTKAEHVASHMLPRQLIRCHCGVRVMREHDEMLGHAQRAHGPGARIASWYDAEALDA